MKRWFPAIVAIVFASGVWSCGSSATQSDSDAGMDSGTGGSTFHVGISLTTGLITFPNKDSGWTVGGGSATNYVAIPSGWSAGGGSATNVIALAPGCTSGGGSATNYTALPSGWSVGGGSATNFIALPPGWTTGGGSSTNFITYPGPSVTTIQVKFDDPGWLGLLKALQDSGNYSETALADVVMYAFLNLRVANHLVEAPAGQW